MLCVNVACTLDELPAAMLLLDRVASNPIPGIRSHTSTSLPQGPGMVSGPGILAFRYLSSQRRRSVG